MRVVKVAGSGDRAVVTRERAGWNCPKPVAYRASTKVWAASVGPVTVIVSEVWVSSATVAVPHTSR